jgi:hypothetical protein
MKRNRALLICVLLFCFGTTFAQPAGYDAEYLKLTKEYVLHDDGSVDYHLRKEIKLLTHFSFHRLLGETFIVYNPEYQSVKINESYTVMADGRKVITPANAFNEVLPAFARDATDYTHLREMVVTHTGTEVGAVIVLDYTISSLKGFRPYLFEMEEIGEIVPVKELTFTVRIPGSKTLHYRLLNCDQEPEIQKLAGYKSYSWSYYDIGAASDLNHYDPGQRAYIQFSTATNMDKPYSVFMSQPAFKDAPGPDIRRRVDDVCREKNGELDIILALQEIVVDEVRTVDIPLRYTGYKLRTPDRIWQSACATPMEKALLLSEMIALAEIDAAPIATATEGLYSREMSSPELFDGFLVKVNTEQSGRIYLPVTSKPSQNLAYNLSGKTLIPLVPGARRMDTFPGEAASHQLELNGDLKITADKVLSGEIEMRLEGIVNPYLRLYRDSLHLKTLLAGNSYSLGQVKGRITELTEAKTEAKVSLTAGKIQDDYSGYMYLDLPGFRNGFNAWNLTEISTADNKPVKLNHKLRESCSYNIEIPAGWQLVNPGGDIIINNDLGRLEININQTGNTLIVRRSWVLVQDIINADSLKDFREMVVAWMNPQYRYIMILRVH